MALLHLNMGKVNLIVTVFNIIAALWSFWVLIRMESLKRENEKKVLVHKLQFEKEFEIYNEVWGKIIHLKEIIGNLRPIYEAWGPLEESIDLRLDMAREVAKNFSDYTERHKPFYSKGVQEALNNLKVVVEKEILQVTSKEFLLKRDGDVFWKDGLATAQKMHNLSEKVHIEIRKRLNILNV